MLFIMKIFSTLFDI